MKYLATTGVTQAHLTAEEARSDWDQAPAHLRTGNPDGMFTLYIQGEMGHRIAPTHYIPIDEDAAPVAPSDT